MSLEDNFNKEVEAWIQHNKENSHHSFAGPYLDCEAYRKIVAMGQKFFHL